MAIISPQTAPNFAFGEYFRILRAELICAPEDPNPRWNILLGFYASEYARKQNSQPMYVHQCSILLSELEYDPREDLYGLLMRTELFAGKNATHDLQPALPAPDDKGLAT